MGILTEFAEDVGDAVNPNKASSPTIETGLRANPISGPVLYASDARDFVAREPVGGVQNTVVAEGERVSVAGSTLPEITGSALQAFPDDPGSTSVDVQPPDLSGLGSGLGSIPWKLILGFIALLALLFALGPFAELGAEVAD